MKVTSYRRTSLILLLSIMAMLIAGLSPHASRAAEKHTAQATAVSGSEYDTFLATALADHKVVRLQEFLHARGFTTNAVQADVTKIDLDGKKSAVVALIPFMDSTETVAARIAFWDGHVDGVRDQDSVAMQGEDNVFAVKGKDVTTLTKGQLEKQLRNPLLQMTGPRPKSAPADKERVTHIAPDGRVTQVKVAPGGNISEQSGVQLLAAGCTSRDVAQTAYTALGYVAYKFWLHKDWCYGNTVTGVNAYVWLSNMDGLP